jgi:hypothetical protein
MDELDSLYLSRDLIEAKLLEMNNDLQEINDDIALLEAERSVDSAFWTEPDENGGRYLVPAMKVREAFEQGSRAQRHWVKTQPVFNNAIMATLTGEVDSDIMDMYGRVSTANLGIQMLKGIMRLMPALDEEGHEIDGLMIPVWGNHGPYKATMAFQSQWVDDLTSILNREMKKAEALMGRMDRRYNRAVRSRTLEAFWKNWPDYIPPEEYLATDPNVGVRYEP